MIGGKTVPGAHFEIIHGTWRLSSCMIAITQDAGYIWKEGSALNRQAASVSRAVLRVVFL
jgi:hypothetical protein